MNLTITDRASLERTLREHGIPLERWGVEKAKSPADLLKEILSGESTLQVLDGKLVRSLRVVFVDVCFNKEGKLLVLKEDRQIFADGRTRSRELEGSIGEKLVASEDEALGARRGLHEELGFPIDIEVRPYGISRETIESPSFPGLTSEYLKYRFSTTISADLFKAEGYVEDDGRKETYFVWTEAQS
ncbi:MAG TPA: hypothetical protein VFQ72_01595 [Candidatus Paceibacterota bacterium]|nr:hypothetical protein [Candidatus Paceibacterota bacterium]